MHERADRLAGFVSVDQELEREFEARLVESSTLAFRVAFGVLRSREDAEDVAQEAFAKAYRSFRQLRERDRFRAWLVRRVAWVVGIMVTGFLTVIGTIAGAFWGLLQVVRG